LTTDKHTPGPSISDQKIELLYDQGLQKVSDRPAFGLYVKGYVSSPIGIVEFYPGRAIADPWASRIQNCVNALSGVKEPEEDIEASLKALEAMLADLSPDLGMSPVLAKHFGVSKARAELALKLFGRGD